MSKFLWFTALILLLVLLASQQAYQDGNPSF